MVSISRLVPRKGFDVAIEAAALLAPSRPDLVLAISGGGRDERRLRRLAAERKAPVRFLGRVANDRLPALYACADVFTMACRTRWGGLEQEGFGIVFVEAAACGVPQVAGDSGGAAEAVDDGVTGLVVRHPEDPGEVAAAFEAPARRPGPARRHGPGVAQAGRGRVLLRRARRAPRPTSLGCRLTWDRRGEPGSMGDVHDDGTQAAVADGAAATGGDGGSAPSGGGRSGRARAAPAVPDRLVGDVVIRADLAGTLLFGVTAGLAAILFTSVWQWIAAITALALFAIGVFAFLWSYYNAVQRSRTDAISVSGLYLLLGPPTPARVRRVDAGDVAAATGDRAGHHVGPEPEGPTVARGRRWRWGSSCRCSGFGLNGLWAAYHGDFPSRELFEDRSRS